MASDFESLKVEWTWTLQNQVEYSSTVLLHSYKI